MVSRVYTVSFLGLKVEEVEVQVHIGAGLPAFLLWDLPIKQLQNQKKELDLHL